MIKIQKTSKLLTLFIIGGISYFLIEILWRGYSHFSMFILGGLCFISIGAAKDIFLPVHNSLIIQQGISCLIITVLELIFGLVLNSVLGLNVWDYSDLRYNLMGQISLLYTILWFFLSLPTIIFYDYIRYWMFKENKPTYKYI